jgi:hypothetical protein
VIRYNTALGVDSSSVEAASGEDSVTSDGKRSIANKDRLGLTE